jgi:peptidoglycan/LPS O-acetylase OafA/YrhL
MLINIQFLRFAAAFAVVLYHASKHLHATGADPGWLFTAGEAVGFAGVDVFFVISGFIMFYTTREVTGGAASADFLKRRLARIYSGYWPFFLAAAAVFGWARPEHFAASNLTTSFLLWPMPLNRVLLDVSWTLSYELYFYLLFTGLVLLPLRRRTLIVVAGVAAVAGYNLLRHFLWQDFSPERLYLHSFANLFLASPYLTEFFAGALLGAVLRPHDEGQPNRHGNDAAAREVASRIDRRARRGAGWILTAGMFGFALGGAVNVFQFEGRIEQGYYMVPRVLAFGIPSVLILWGLVGLERAGYTAPRRFSLYTGGASYAIYLCHTIFLVATMKLGLNRALAGWPDLSVQGVFLLYAVLIVAFSVAWYRFAERPLHRAFKQALRVRRSDAKVRRAPAGAL